MRNPTSCTAKVTTFRASPHTPATGTATGQLSALHPDELRRPRLLALLHGEGRRAGHNGSPTTASTSIDQDRTRPGCSMRRSSSRPTRSERDHRAARRRLSVADFQAGTCPANTVVGYAVAASPLLSQPLSGQVELVDTGAACCRTSASTCGGSSTCSSGAAESAPTRRSPSATCAGLPDIPISHFQLTFTDPPGLLIANRGTSAVPPPPVFHADFAGYNGATSAVDSPATVDGCGAGAVRTQQVQEAQGKKKHKKQKHRAAESKKKHKKHRKKRSCKKKKHHKKHKKRR